MSTSANRLASRQKAERKAVLPLRVASRAIRPGTGDARGMLEEYQRRLGRLEMEVAQQQRENGKLHAAILELERANEYYSRLCEAAPVPQLVLNAAGFILGSNQRSRQLLGISEGRRERVTFSRFLAGGERLALLSHLRECKANRKKAAVRVRLKLRSRSGFGPVQLVTTCFSVPSRADSLFCTCILDDSELRRAEGSLARREREFQSFINSIDGVVWEADAATNQRTFISKQVERLLGYPVEQWMYWPDFWHNRILAEDRDRVLKAYAVALASRKNCMCEYRMMAADRRVVWLRESANVVEEGGKIKLRGISVDITERKQTERELQCIRDHLEESIANRTAELRRSVAELESFSYTLSHDLRAPLRSMHGYSEILLQSFGDKLGPEGRDYLERIMASARRLDGLILDVLNYGKLTQAPLQLQPVDLDKLVRSVVREYPDFQPPKADIEIESPLLPVIGHEGFLTLCISNILSNAVKFVAPGAQPRVRVSTRAMESDVRIWIEDNGVGIAAAAQRTLFGMFQRAHGSAYAGTGMGLAIVHRASERMEGKVGVESQIGKGSKFWLQFKRP